jgi:hypothetical protein
MSGSQMVVDGQKREDLFVRSMTMYIAHWRTRTENHVQTDTALGDRAHIEARELAREDAPFTTTSDIDLGVEV